MNTLELQQKKRTAVLYAFILSGAVLWGCEEDLNINTPGDLVPRTVTEDPLLPSIYVNGTQLHAEAFGNTQDAMLIFLHGGPGSDYKGGLNVKQLTNDGYYVVFYDQRGAGLSQRQDFGTFTIEQYLDDLTGVINYYRTSESQKIFLFGHSWGAMLAAAYINTYPERIAGVIFAEPGGFTDELAMEYGKASRKINLFSEATNNALFYEQFITGKKNDHQILDYKIAIASAYTYEDGNEEGIEGPSPFWRYGAVVLKSFSKLAEDDGFDFTTNLFLYQTKVLFIYGENNKAYGLEGAQKEAAFLPNTEIVQIDDTGHELIYFKWESVYPVVLNYLNSLK